MPTVSPCLPCRSCATMMAVGDFVRDRSKSCGYKRVCKPCESERKRSIYKPKVSVAKTLTCAQCSSPFESSKPRAKYCGKTCLDRAMAVRFHLERQCMRCDVSLTGSRAKRWCSDCRIEARRERDRERMRIMGSGDRRRARHHNVAYEKVSRKVVYVRDGWMCGLCRQGVDGSLKWPHDMSASLDHVVPISLGGPHLYSNVQLAHLGCNVAKRDSLGIGPESLAEALP